MTTIVDLPLSDFVTCASRTCRALLVQPTAAADVTETDVFTAGSEGYHTFRIPALVVTKKGTLLAICEGRKTGRGDHGDLDLVQKRSTDGGKTWGKLELIHEEGGEAKVTIGNPCPVVDQDTGIIWLPFNARQRQGLHHVVERRRPDLGQAARDHGRRESHRLELVCHRPRQRHSVDAWQIQRPAGDSLRPPCERRQERQGRLGQGGPLARHLFRRPRPNLEAGRLDRLCHERVRGRRIDRWHAACSTAAAIAARPAAAFRSARTAARPGSRRPTIRRSSNRSARRA